MLETLPPFENTSIASRREGSTQRFVLCVATMRILSVNSVERQCFVDYHDEMFYGLAYEDRKVVNKMRKEWVMPSQTRQKNNHRHIQNIKNSIELEE